MRTKRKGPSIPKRDTTTPISRSDEAAYNDMERELERLNQEMKRLEELHQRSPSRQTRKALLEMEETVVEMDERIISFLKDRPQLAAKVKRPEPMPVREHSSEEDWRDRLRQQQEDLENSLLEKLRNEQERRQHEWHKSERTRLDEQERKLLNAIADRQAKLEDEWQMRRKHETEAQALAWLRGQQKEVTRQLQDGMVRIRQEMAARETQWQQQTKRELAELEREWRKQRNADLQYLEAAWREQEIMHRERAYLRRMEAEWKAAQKSMLEELAAQWKSGLELSQRRQVEEIMLEYEKHWSATQERWHGEFSTTLEVAKVTVTAGLREELSASLKAMGALWVHEQQQSYQAVLCDLRTEAGAERQALQNEWENLKVELRAVYTEERKHALEALQLDYQAKLAEWLAGASEQHKALLRQSERQYVTSLEQCMQELRSFVGSMVHAEVIEQVDRSLPPLVTDFERRHHEQVEEWIAHDLQSEFDKWRLGQEARVQVSIQQWQDLQFGRLQARYDIWTAEEDAKLQLSLADTLARLRAHAEDSLDSLCKESLGKWDARANAALTHALEECSQEQMRALVDVRGRAEKSISDKVAIMTDELRQATISLHAQLKAELNATVELQCAERQREAVSALKAMLEDKALAVEQEYVRQHQQEIELLGQELRVDLKRELEKVGSRMENDHGHRLAQLGAEYLRNFDAELLRLQQRMMELHDKTAQELHTRWQGESAAHLTELSKDLREEERRALYSLEQDMVAEYHRALAAVALEDAVKRENQGKELLAALLSRYEDQARAWAERMDSELLCWQGSFATLQGEYRQGVLALEQKMVEEYKGMLSWQEQRLLDLHKAQLVSEYDKWQTLCAQQTLEVSDQLLHDFGSRLGALEEQLIGIHRQRVESLKGEMHLDYRARLGKLVEDLLEKHRSELARVVEERDEALRQEFIKAQNRTDGQQPDKPPSPQKTHSRPRRS